MVQIHSPRPILLSISVEQEELRTLQRQDEEIQSNSQRLVGVDTSAALAFANQLDVDRVVLQVEIKDLTFRLQEFQDYLKKNF